MSNEAIAVLVATIAGSVASAIVATLLTLYVSHRVDKARSKKRNQAVLRTIASEIHAHTEWIHALLQGNQISIAGVRAKLVDLQWQQHQNELWELDPVTGVKFRQYYDAIGQVRDRGFTHDDDLASVFAPLLELARICLDKADFPLRRVSISVATARIVTTAHPPEVHAEVKAKGQQEDGQEATTEQGASCSPLNIIGHDMGKKWLQVAQRVVDGSKSPSVKRWVRGSVSLLLLLLVRLSLETQALPLWLIVYIGALASLSLVVLIPASAEVAERLGRAVAYPFPTFVFLIVTGLFGALISYILRGHPIHTQMYLWFVSSIVIFSLNGEKVVSFAWSLVSEKQYGQVAKHGGRAYRAYIYILAVITYVLSRLALFSAPEVLGWTIDSNLLLEVLLTFVLVDGALTTLRGGHRDIQQRKV